VLALASAEWVALIGAAATISAAATLAGVAAITTNRRQTKALKDAGERQERALAADAERQRRELNARAEEQQQQLDHARKLADLADLRQLLDEAAAALNDAVDASHRLHMAAGEHGSSLAHNAGDEVADCGRRLVTLNARLQVRLGKDDPVALHFDGGCNAMWGSWRHAHPSPEETGTELIERRKQMHDAWQALNSSLDEFLAAAVKRAGTVPMHGG
jgi:DNA repair exonuclease SbcCD ATPase subunit